MLGEYVWLERPRVAVCVSTLRLQWSLRQRSRPLSFHSRLTEEIFPGKSCGGKQIYLYVYIIIYIHTEDTNMPVY